MEKLTIGSSKVCTSTRDRRKIYAFLLVLILTALSTTFALLYFTNLDNTPNNNVVVPSNDTARFVALTPSDSWGNPVGMTMAFWFTITIHNEADNKIEGLALNLTIADTSPEIYGWGTTNTNRRN